MKPVNLDRLCAQYGWQIAHEVYEAIQKQAENHITKSLGVLQEDGVYAFFLYQISRGEGEKVGAERIKEQASSHQKSSGVQILSAAKRLLCEAGIEAFQGTSDPLRAVQELADDLDQLLLAKRLLEQALIYARYHAKALEG